MDKLLEKILLLVDMYPDSKDPLDTTKIDALRSELTDVVDSIINWHRLLKIPVNDRLFRMNSNLTKLNKELNLVNESISKIENNLDMISSIGENINITSFKEEINSLKERKSTLVSEIELLSKKVAELEVINRESVNDSSIDRAEINKLENKEKEIENKIRVIVDHPVNCLEKIKRSLAEGDMLEVRKLIDIIFKQVETVPYINDSDKDSLNMSLTEQTNIRNELAAKIASDKYEVNPTHYENDRREVINKYMESLVQLETYIKSFCDDISHEVRDVTKKSISELNDSDLVKNRTEMVSAYLEDINSVDDVVNFFRNDSLKLVNKVIDKFENQRSQIDKIIVCNSGIVINNAAKANDIEKRDLAVEQVRDLKHALKFSILAVDLYNEVVDSLNNLVIETEEVDYKEDMYDKTSYNISPVGELSTEKVIEDVETDNILPNDVSVTSTGLVTFEELIRNNENGVINTDLSDNNDQSNQVDFSMNDNSNVIHPTSVNNESINIIEPIVQSDSSVISNSESNVIDFSEYKQYESESNIEPIMSVEVQPEAIVNEVEVINPIVNEVTDFVQPVVDPSTINDIQIIEQPDLTINDLPADSIGNEIQPDIVVPNVGTDNLVEDVQNINYSNEEPKTEVKVIDVKPYYNNMSYFNNDELIEEPVVPTEGQSRALIKDGIPTTDDSYTSDNSSLFDENMDNSISFADIPDYSIEMGRAS